MAKKNSPTKKLGKKKKTSIGNSKFSKAGAPGPYGGNKTYKKPYRGQGK